MKSARLGFIIGFPRSGTKILRDLLGNHEDVGINPYESNFLIGENILKSYEDQLEVEKLVQTITSNTIYENDKQLNLAIKNETWREVIGYPKTIEEMYLYFFKHQSADTVLFFDKSPRYTSYVDEIANLFPNAKFLHIVRDPRDIALSTKRTWGRSMVRAAEQWNKVIVKVLRSKAQQEGNILCIKYENLLISPLDTLRIICEFFQISNSNLNKLVEADLSNTEKYGHAAKSTGVITANTGKYQDISKATLQKN